MIRVTIYFFLAFTTSFGLAMAKDGPEGMSAQTIQEEEVSEQLSKFKNELEVQIKEKEELSEEAHEKSQKTGSALGKSLADYLSELQIYHSELLEAKLLRVKELEAALNVMRDESKLLTDLENKLNAEPQSIRPADLEIATKVWRQIVDKTLSKLFETDLVTVKEAVSPPDGIELSPDKYIELRTSIAKTKKDIDLELEGMRASFIELKDTERDVRSGLLLNSGRVRSRLMNHLIDKGQYSAWSFFENSVQDYIREVQIVPYRFLATFTQKYFEFKSLSLEGPRGWLSILKQIILLAFVLVLPILIFGLFKKFSHFMNETRKKIFTHSKLDYRTRTRLAVWIGRVNPYLPWAFAYLTILIAGESLRGSMLDPLVFLLPYLSIYVGYHIFRLAFSSLLANVLLSKNLGILRNSQTKVEVTAKLFSVILFIEIAILHATQDAVRKALIYNIIFDFILVFNIFLVCFESRRWKAELTDLGARWLPGALVSRLGKPNFIVFELIFYPLIFILNVSYVVVGWFTDWVSQYEIGKKLLSELFRKRLEEAVEENGEVEKTLPESYRELFLTNQVDEDVRVSLSRSPFRACVKHIEDWENGRKYDDLLLIYGNYGIGKTTILKSLEAKVRQSLDVKHISLNERITGSAALFKKLSEHLGAEIQSAQSLEDWEKTAEKTVIILDDIHNLYLNEVDGLSAYRTLIHLTSLQLDNVFWCLSCDERAWAHLAGVFGATHFVGKYIELHSWTDGEIQELITKRHEKSSMKLKFDPIIGAVHRGDILESSSGLEVQFFRMLWGQSRGNPKTAQELWLTATYMNRSSEVRVSVPDFTNARELTEFSDQALLLFASIAKHECLNFEELQTVTDVAESTIRQALKLGEDGAILQKMPSGDWRIHPKAQYVVHAQLSGRNLIYG